MTPRARRGLSPWPLAVGMLLAVSLAHTRAGPLIPLAALALGLGGLAVTRWLMHDPARRAEETELAAAPLGGRSARSDEAARATLASLPDSVLILDLAGRITFANEAARGAFAIDDEGGAGSEAARALLSALGPVRAHVLAGRGVFAPRGFGDSLRIDPGDGPRHFLPRAAPLYGEAGEITGVICLLHDVTRLAHADQLADDVVATVAHELKTPLTSLHMAVHLCLDGLAGPLTDKQTELLHAARDDCERIRALIDEILDLARLQSGRVRLERSPIRAAALVNDVIAAHRAAAEHARIALAAECLPDCPEVLADRERLGLTLANLVANAIRHTPEGGRVRVGCAAAEAGVRFEVTDSGPGIPAEHRARIFERFYQIPGRARGGSGLGLTLAKEIVEAHGGTIGVEDAPPSGSRFFFTIP